MKSTSTDSRMISKRGRPAFQNLPNKGQMKVTRGDVYYVRDSTP